MKHDKLINVKVDRKLHSKYKRALQARGKGESVQYKLGEVCNEEMRAVVRGAGIK